ncbi:MAG: hypothetical protein JOZ48_03925 [Acidobacteriaceae bacterium]|nr:hypothetical protein [Acidobacteriaceae bacterium]
MEPELHQRGRQIDLVIAAKTLRQTRDFETQNEPLYVNTKSAVSLERLRRYAGVGTQQSDRSCSLPARDKIVVPTASRDRLPNPDRAIVDIAKLRDYCLNPNHEDGKHKARVFASALGIRQSDADWLRQILLLAAREQEARILGENRFGTLYVLDVIVETPFGSAVVRSGWIVQSSEGFPRLTTCYVKGAE